MRECEDGQPLRAKISLWFHEGPLSRFAADGGGWWFRRRAGTYTADGDATVSTDTICNVR